MQCEWVDRFRTTTLLHGRNMPCCPITTVDTADDRFVDNRVFRGWHPCCLMQGVVTSRLCLVPFLLFALAGGCVANRADSSNYTRRSPVTTPLKSSANNSETSMRFDRERKYRSVAALAFAVPITRYNPPLDLSREGRGSGAFVGYEQSTVQYLWVRTDDRQSSGPGWWGHRGGYGGGSWQGDRFDRRAISVEEKIRVR